MSRLGESDQRRLTRLHGKGLPDSAIAERLGEPWTTRMVRYRRKQLRLRSNGRYHQPTDGPRVYGPRAYMAQRGWQHLVAGWQEHKVAGRRQKFDYEGFDLRRAEVDILCLLRDEGAQTRQQLADACRVTRLRLWPSLDPIVRLLEFGLIQKKGTRRIGRGFHTLYELSEKAGYGTHGHEG